MNKNNIVFLIRSYNEATRIGEVISKIFSNGFTEILVVDDGSIDGTEKLLHNQFGEKLHYVKHVVNRGAGAALETGFSYIRRNKLPSWKYVVTFDADGQHDIDDIKGFTDIFEKESGVDVVFGSRFIEKTNSNVPFLRKIILFGGRIFTALISGVRLTDAHNGYRMLKIDVLEKIYLTMDGMEYASELIEEIHVHGFLIREVPVNIHYDEYTLGKGQRFGGAFRIALRMLWKKFFS